MISTSKILVLFIFSNSAKLCSFAEDGGIEANGVKISEAEKREAIQELEKALKFYNSNEYVKYFMSCNELEKTELIRKKCFDWRYMHEMILILMENWQMLKGTIENQLKIRENSEQIVEKDKISKALLPLITCKIFFTQELEKSKLNLIDAMHAVCAAHRQMRGTNKTLGTQFYRTLNFEKDSGWSSQVQNWNNWIESQQNFDELSEDRVKLMRKITAQELDSALLVHAKIARDKCNEDVFNQELRSACHKWHQFYEKLEEFLTGWKLLKAVMEQHKKKLDKAAKSPSKKTIPQLDTDTTKFLNYRPMFYQKLYSGGMILNMPEVLEIVRNTKSQIFEDSEEPPETPQILNHANWQKQLNSWNEWLKRPENKLNLKAKMGIKLNEVEKFLKNKLP